MMSSRSAPPPPHHDEPCDRQTRGASAFPPNNCGSGGLRCAVSRNGISNANDGRRSSYYAIKIKESRSTSYHDLLPLPKTIDNFPPPHRLRCINIMFEPQSDDDSSQASSGDEMLNLVPFSQETTTSSTTPEKSASKVSEDGANNAFTLKPRTKRKHDECTADEAKMEEKGESLPLCDYVSCKYNYLSPFP